MKATAAASAMVFVLLSLCGCDRAGGWRVVKYTNVYGEHLVRLSLAASRVTGEGHSARITLVYLKGPLSPEDKAIPVLINSGQRPYPGVQLDLPCPSSEDDKADGRPLLISFNGEPSVHAVWSLMPIWNPVTKKFKTVTSTLMPDPLDPNKKSEFVLALQLHRTLKIKIACGGFYNSSQMRFDLSGLRYAMRSAGLKATEDGQ